MESFTTSHEIAWTHCLRMTSWADGVGRKESDESQTRCECEPLGEQTIVR
jgi:hypothetical protein